MLGVPHRVEAHFDIQFKHNYNAVSRSHCYRFIDRVFDLGQPDAGIEREFERLDRSQLSVWDAAHPAPAGSVVGDEHERAVCRAWADDAQRQIMPLLDAADTATLAAAHDLLGEAFGVIIGRALPAAADIAFDQALRPVAVTAGAAAVKAGLVHVISHGERIPTIVMEPAGWQGDVAIWPHPEGKQGLFTPAGELVAAVRAVLDRGTAVIAADLFGQGEAISTARADEVEKDRARLDPSYVYGYNPSAYARRVHDLLALVAFARGGLGRPTRRVTLVGIDGAGHWAAGALAALRPWSGSAAVDRAVIDTEGFRFAGIRDVWSADFLPGGVKYGDVPAMLAFGVPTTMVIHDPDQACGRLLKSWARTAGRPECVTLLRNPTGLHGAIAPEQP